MGTTGNRRRTVLVVVAAAVLGLIAGGLTGLLRPTPAAAADPLHLGVPFAALPCSGAAILVVGVGDSRAPLAAAVADNRGAGVRYLATRRSCPTQYGPVDKPRPAYVAYLGPYAATTQPCALRMDVAHKGDDVTRLQRGDTTYVKCVCELATATMPTLSVGMDAGPDTGIWVRQLQAMLVDLDARRFPPTAITGVYDERTAARIRTMQAANSVPATGVVDQVTWRIVRDRICPTYDY